MSQQQQQSQQQKQNMHNNNNNNNSDNSFTSRSTDGDNYSTKENLLRKPGCIILPNWINTQTRLLSLNPDSVKFLLMPAINYAMYVLTKH